MSNHTGHSNTQFAIYGTDGDRPPDGVYRQACAACGAVHPAGLPCGCGAGVTRVVDPATQVVYTETPPRAAGMAAADMARAGWVAAAEFARVLAMLEACAAERDAARAEATDLRAKLTTQTVQLRQTSDILAAERRAAAVGRGRA